MDEDDPTHGRTRVLHTENEHGEVRGTRVNALTRKSAWFQETRLPASPVARSDTSKCSSDVRTTLKVRGYPVDHVGLMT